MKTRNDPVVAKKSQTAIANVTTVQRTVRSGLRRRQVPRR